MGQIYNYKARNSQGELISGYLEEDDSKEVVVKLDRLGYSILEITAQSQLFSSFSSVFNRFKRLSKQEVIIFTRQLSTLLRAGMALSPALSTICEQTVNKKFKVILEDIRQSVQGGVSFSRALSKYPAIFPEIFVSMVEVGETGGLLDKVLTRLADLGMQQLEVSSRIKAAMIYPVVLVIVAFVIVNFLLVGVLPKFVVVFRSAQTRLPLPTIVVLGVSLILRKMWFPIMLVLGVIAVWFRKYINTDKGKMKVYKWMLTVPIFGELYTKIQISRFARTLSALTSSGIPLLQGLVVVEKTVTNVVIRKAIQDIRLAITKGNPLAEQFKISGLFSPMVVQMISIGEKSGRLDQSLEEISSFFDPEVEYTIKNLTSLLEPFMLLVMGGMVGVIALSVLLPIFNLIKVFRG